MDETEGGQNRESSPQFLRAMAVIEAVARSEHSLTLSEVAEQVRIPKPTVLRIVSALVSAQLLQRVPGAKRYLCGSRLNQLAIETLLHSPQWGARRAVLAGLVDEIGETCNLAVLDGDQLVYVDRVESSWPLQMRLSPGSHVPLHCTASGKLFLTQFSPERLDTFLHRAPLRPFTDRTITDPRQLQRELERVREAMIGTDDAEYIAGLVAVSVPVYNRKGRMCATLAVHGPIGRMTLDSALECVPAMKRTAASLSLAWFGPGEA